MSRKYEKVFKSITESSIWSEPTCTRIVWITLLAKADRHGRFFGNSALLAHLANVTLDECENALKTLLSPDQYAVYTDNEGRRIEAIDNGWRFLNPGWAASN